MASIEKKLCYSGASALSEGTGGLALSLVSATDAPRAREFLRAFAREPEVTAKALRAVSEIVGSRFYVPPAMLARILREADPVATVGTEAVRFEGFSACCSAFIRHDLLDGSLEVTERGKGTTNVDFGPELRAALARVRKNSTLEVSIGPEAVEIEADGAAVVERKVPLPVRWLKGFAEVQNHMADMEHAFTLDRARAIRFLRALPRGKSDHLQWVSTGGTGLRLTARETPGAVPLRGAQRLRILDTVVPLAQALEIHVNRELGSSAWVLDFGTQRLCLVLNAEPWRGFSGDGRLLSDLAGEGEGALAALRAALNWQDRLDPVALAAQAGQPEETVRAGLARLAANGLLGFDLASGTYFHRVLPYDLEKVAALNPRLTAARALVEKGAVTIEVAASRALVQSGDVRHEVRFEDETPSCTCPWYAKNKGARGPCKHVLAVEIAMDDKT